MRMIRFALLASILLTTGCSGAKEDDLDLWMKQRKAQTKGTIEPLPELKKYTPFVYNADGALSDPFKGRMAIVAGVQERGELKPDLNRPREALESFPLESLKFVGYLEQGKKSVALIAAPDNNVYQIRPGNYMGQNFGVVTAISKDEVAIKEMVLDGTGNYVERRVTLNPQE
ncbi:MAG: pilus assembly protein PilP [Methylophilaceae bacterium]|nr:pilus assembly protein PilP [Methylophilaceae bacterium]